MSCRKHVDGAVPTPRKKWRVPDQGPPELRRKQGLRRSPHCEAGGRCITGRQPPKSLRPHVKTRRDRGQAIAAVSAIGGNSMKAIADHFGLRYSMVRWSIKKIRDPRHDSLHLIAKKIKGSSEVIRAAWASAENSYSQIADHFGLFFTTVGRIVRQRRWPRHQRACQSRASSCDLALDDADGETVVRGLLALVLHVATGVAFGIDDPVERDAGLVVPTQWPCVRR